MDEVKKDEKHVTVKCHKCGGTFEVSEKFINHPRLKSYILCQECLMKRFEEHKEAN